jgi:predicted RNA binding protein YcfA (HicA-like mRNA interferase family)
MPKQRRLNGREVIKILEKFGFSIDRISGSHHTLLRMVDNHEQTVTVPVHGHQSLRLGTLKNIYRRACEFIDEDELKKHFYTD